MRIPENHQGHGWKMKSIIFDAREFVNETNYVRRNDELADQLRLTSDSRITFPRPTGDSAIKIDDILKANGLSDAVTSLRSK